MGRLAYKPKLDRNHVLQRALELRRQGLTQTDIAVELDCSQGLVQRLLKMSEPRPSSSQALDGLASSQA
jgi:orotate phosphoribosyltransferase-like protein